VIRKDRTACTLEIWALWLKLTDGLLPDEIVFLDRSVSDCLAFFRIAVIDPREYCQTVINIVMHLCLFSTVYRMNRTVEGRVMMNMQIILTCGSNEIIVY